MEKGKIEVITIESDGDERILEVNEDYLIKTLRRKPKRKLKSLTLKRSIQAIEKSDLIRSLMNNQFYIMNKIDFCNKTGKNFNLKMVCL